MLIHIINSLPWSSFTEVNFLTYCLLNKGTSWESKLQPEKKKGGGRGGERKKDFQPDNLSDKYRKK